MQQTQPQAKAQLTNQLKRWKISFIVFAYMAAAAISSPAQTLTVLHKFTGGTDGYSPCCGLVQGLDAKFYGTTTQFGANNNGTIFKISSAGTLTAYPISTSTISSGANLLLATDGNFYGTSYHGGSASGTVFSLTSSGKVTLLYSFQGGTDGNGPNALVRGRDGNFYGTTFEGGVNLCTYQGWCGTVFKITPSGTLTYIHYFCSVSPCADGAYPLAGGFILGTDGNFYGTASSDGANGGGIFFKMTSSGELTILYNFCSQANCADGGGPAALVQGTDGNFYGTTDRGGDLTCASNGCGTVFKITPAGKLTTLYAFNDPKSGSPSSLVQGIDGNFYGTFPYGGDLSCYSGQGCGSIFRITPKGKLTILHNLHLTEGAQPGPLVQGTDGNFYGTAQSGGSHNGGTVFSLSVGLKPFVKSVPITGDSGDCVNILGTDLTGASKVTFNGVEAQFKILSPTEIHTTVPAGATTGKIEVVTPSGTLSSNVAFQVF